MPHRTFNFLMFYPLFLLLAITCFDMISRRILFTKKMYKKKNTKNVCSQFWVLQYAWNRLLYGFFFLSDCRLNTKFCSRSLPVSFVLFVLDPLWYDFPGCTCYWDDERIRKANKNFLLQKMTFFQSLVRTACFSLSVFRLLRDKVSVPFARPLSQLLSEKREVQRERIVAKKIRVRYRVAILTLIIFWR